MAERVSEEAGLLLDQVVVPDPIPVRKIPGYRMPEHARNLLPWDFVATQMQQASHYWLNTTFGDGRPHAVPVWGIWYQDRVHFEGGMKTMWARNLVRDPRIVVHPPDPEQVVAIEGVARIIDNHDIDDDEWRIPDTQFQNKYNVDKGSPYWYVQPTKVIAWNGGALDTMTRWIFTP